MWNTPKCMSIYMASKGFGHFCPERQHQWFRRRTCPGQNGDLCQGEWSLYYIYIYIYLRTIVHIYLLSNCSAPRMMIRP